MYLGNEQRAEITGSSMKEETCEACGAPYVYIAQRSARGGSFSLLGMDNQGAQNRAEQQAAAALEKSLHRAHDLVQCPRCNHFHSAGIRQKKLKLLPYAGVLAFLGLFPCVFYGATQNAKSGRDAGLIAAAMAVAVLLAMVGVLVGVLWVAYDPNKGRFFPFPDRGRRGMIPETPAEPPKPAQPARRAPRPMPRQT